MARVGIVQPRQIPAPIGGELRNSVCTPRYQLPQILGRLHPAGEPAARRHNRNKLLTPLLQLAKTPASLTQISSNQLEVIAKFIFIRHLGATILASTDRAIQNSHHRTAFTNLFPRNRQAQYEIRGKADSGGLPRRRCPLSLEQIKRLVPERTGFPQFGQLAGMKPGLRSPYAPGIDEVASLVAVSTWSAAFSVPVMLSFMVR